MTPSMVITEEHTSVHKCLGNATRATEWLRSDVVVIRKLTFGACFVVWFGFDLTWGLPLSKPRKQARVRVWFGLGLG